MWPSFVNIIPPFIEDELYSNTLLYFTLPGYEFNESELVGQRSHTIESAVCFLIKYPN